MLSRAAIGALLGTLFMALSPFMAPGGVGPMGNQSPTSWWIGYLIISVILGGGVGALLGALTYRRKRDDPASKT